jgi:2-succinyl-5-enolpyruvyl-6-hydroxy-3-cyclohexene-1-carboxylate synthase
LDLTASVLYISCFGPQEAPIYYLCLMSVLRQNLDHLATLLHTAGITRWVVSPGSRNAPIVAGLLRHGGFELHSFPDERSAAFAALGMSMGEKYPTGILCTSGSAVLNLYPAICEAYYQRIPLLVLTADRPAELVDQWDGQTIHQKDVFEKHILGSFEVPEMDDDYSTLLLEKMVFEAVELAVTPLQGPVHINVPLRDPIYSGLEEPFEAIEVENPFTPRWSDFPEIDAAVLYANLQHYKKILLLVGQSLPNVHASLALDKLSSQYPIFADITSNQSLHAVDGWEAALSSTAIPDEMLPELIISIGLSFVSKPLKKFLQRGENIEHWHIAPAGFVGDPFLTDPETKNTDPSLFLQAMAMYENQNCTEYAAAWRAICADKAADVVHWQHLKKHHVTEFKMVRQVLQNAGKKNAIHLGNSMPVRYACWTGKSEAEIYANRGTSGIDGSLSTALGYAISRSDQQVICITGDIGFFYDSNAFWCDKIPANLKVILLNNAGGKIFEFIDGPEQEPGLKKFIQTPHHFTAQHIAAHYGIAYQTSETLPNQADLQAFLAQEGCAIWEITTAKK